MADGDRPIVLVPLATARRAARRAGVTLNLSAEDIALAGKWKHGWIPLDAVASAVKAKRYHGGGGEGRTVKGKGRAGSAVESRREQSRGRAKVKVGAPERASGPRREPHISAEPMKDGRHKLTDPETGESVKAAHLASFHDQGHTITGVRNGQMHTRDDYGKAHVYDPATGRAATAPASLADHARTHSDASLRDLTRRFSEGTAEGRAVRAEIARRQSAAPLEGKSFGSMTAAERAKATEVMHGTGSKQHRKALATARAQQAAQDRTRRVEAARGGPKLADLSETDLQGLISRYGEKSVQADAARAEMLRRSGGEHRQGPGGVARLADPKAYDKGKAGGNGLAEMAKLRTDAELRRLADRSPGTAEGRAAKAELRHRARRAK